MAAVVNARDVQLQNASSRLLGVQIGDNVTVPPTNIPGIEDLIESSKSLSLATTSQVFQMLTAGGSSPTSITVVAQIRNLVNTPTFGIVPGSGTMSVTPVLTAGSFTFTADQLTSPSVTFRLTVVEDGKTYSDDMTVVKVEEGSDGVTALLTNENYTFSADSNGIIGSYVGCSGNFKVYQGIVDVTSTCTFAIAPGGNPDSLSVSLTASGTNAGLYSVNGGFPNAKDNTTVTIRATYGTMTIDKTLSLSKARAGIKGADGTGGTQGPRGAGQFFYESSTTSWSDAVANTVASVGGGPIFLDRVQQFNNVAGWTQTRYWDGGSWVIVSAAVDGNLIVTGSIGAKSLKVNNGTGNNLWWDANYEQPDQWTLTGNNWGILPIQATVADGKAGQNVMRSPSGQGSEARFAKRVPVVVGRQYRVSIWARQNGANGTLYFRLDTGSTPTGAYGQVVTGAAENLTVPTTWTKYTAVWTATAPYVGGMVLLNYRGGVADATGYMEAQDFRVEEMMDKALVVTGGLDADVIDTRGLSIKDAAGNVILAAGATIGGSTLNLPGNINNTPANWLNQNQQWTDVVNRPKTYRVAARGLSTSTAPIESGLYDADNGGTIEGAGGMYVVVKINRTTKVKTFLGVFNPLSGAGGALAQCNAMADALNSIDSSHICVVYTFDEPQSNRMLGNLPAAMYRNGASQTVWGSPNFRYRGAYILISIGGCGEGNGFEQYSGKVDSDTNAWCDVTFSISPSGAFNVSGAKRGATGLTDYGYTGDLNASATVSLLSQGGVNISGSSVTKSGSVGGWDSAAYSKDSYAGAAFCSWSPGNVTSMMGGLNTDPTTDAGYISLDTAWYAETSGNAYIFESGTGVAGPWAYSVGDVFSIVHDGVTVRYYQNGVLRREVPWGTTAPVYFDTSFHTPGAVMKNIQFGPVSSNQWSAVGGPGRPQDNATYGATFGTNIFGQINPANVSTYIASAAINLAQINVASIGSLSALSATIGMLRTQPTGARVEISDNLIQVFYSNGQTAVRISS